MTVTGYLALYTTLIGWQQYQNLWTLMVGTGLVFIPLIGIVLKCFLEPFESQEPKSAAVIALRRLMIQIVGALLVIEFCCVPTVSLNPKVLHYEPACVASTKIATPGHTNTTYDNEFKAITGVRIPIIWYLVMVISNGFTHAASESIACQAINYRQLQGMLNVTHITNPQIKKETIQFYNDCYVPAYSKYMSNDLSNTQKLDIEKYQHQYGKEDLAWIGSLAFLHTPGFYNTLSAREPIPGFAFEPTRDQFEGQVNDHSQWGEPNCQAWWADPENGLHSQLQNALPPVFLTQIIHINDNPKVLADLGIRNLIKHSFDPGMNFGEISRGYESLNDDIHGNWLSEYVGSSIGVSMEQMSYYPKLTLLINSLPVIQALLLMSIYSLLALVIPFSNYRLHFIITGAAIIFAVTFWSYLWHLVLYVDNALIAALYPKDGGTIAIEQWLHNNGGFNKMLVDFIIGTLYIALPLLFLILMSWAGLTVSNVMINAFSDMSSPSQAAGAEAGAMGKAALRTAISVIKTAINKKN